MQVSVARRVERRSGAELGAFALLGFGAGIAAGFLLSEVFGSGGHRRVGRLLRPDRAGFAPTRTVLLARVREVLAGEGALAGEPIEVRARGRGLELTGWVATRSARGLAHRRAREAVAGALEVSNHLLVRGEDDRAAAREESPRTA